MIVMVNGMTVDVVFSDGHTEQVGIASEWIDLLSRMDDMETNLWATITPDMYDAAIQELQTITDLSIAERVATILTVAKENNIESVVFI